MKLVVPYSRSLGFCLIVLLLTSALSCTKEPTPTPGTVTKLSISGFSPASGETGTEVTIAGSFPTASAITISFNGVSTSIKSKSTTELVALVPLMALSGPISLTIDGITLQTSSSFLVKPKVTSLSTAIGPSGTTVTIVGSGFDPSATTIQFNGTASIPSSITQTTINTTVPNNSTSGPVVVSVGTLTGDGGMFTVVESNAVLFGTTSRNLGTAVAVDGTGNTYLAGTFRHQFSIGGTMLTPEQPGSDHTFLVKYDANMNISWASQPGGSGTIVQSMVVDATGNVYLGGLTRPFATFGSFTVPNTTPSNPYKCFVAKMNSGGTFLWLNYTQTSSDTKTVEVALDNQGNVYATGDFSETITFSSLPSLVEGFGSSDIFVTRYNTSDGVATQSFSLGGDQGERESTMAVDQVGNIYVAGTFSIGTTSIGGTSLTNSGFSTDGFLIKLNASGVSQWVKHLAGPNEDRPSVVRLDANGKVYVAGHFHSTATFAGQTMQSLAATDMFVARLDGAAGTVDWVTKGGGSTWDYGLCLSVESNGVSYVGGSAIGNFQMGTRSLTASGTEEDIVVAKIDPNGDVVWAMRGGSIQNDGVAQLSISGTTLSIIGFVKANATFFQTQLTHQGEEDAVFWKLNFD